MTDDRDDLLARIDVLEEALAQIASAFSGRPGEFDQSHDVVSADVKRIALAALPAALPPESGFPFRSKQS